ncbi:MAG TPA: four helix bundle protein [Ignavibacteria bacterium]|nr:four helix bundle protein [Ignavibacteria bacterium]HMR40901.1 four helix bundle protein [Ignavibacteria bacterium]
MGNSILKDKSFALAIKIVQVYKKLSTEKKEYVMSKQLLRSGTSVGANVREAKNAESTNDFIHKLGIAQKECDKTLYWLDLLFVTGFLDNITYYNVTDEANQILKMIKSSILTLKQKNLKVRNS